ncbi:galactokinase [Gordonia spumicola]|uniref:Galactokinase n=1 Tax=Gordonia spumicola TaxID=589161 RepID=A0A7I9VEI8_9ACTN|nr:galactokinase [Gordonia spumicola]GEE03758.1 galactokinase [Gordonia spumicola]
MTSVRAYAPGRVNLIGEHTDYNDGFSLPIALDRGTVVDLEVDETATHLRVETASDVDSASTSVIALDTSPGDVTGWAAYVAGCVWALRGDGVDVPGGRMRVGSDVPLGAGLSSSAALECAAVLAIAAAAGLRDVDRMTAARWAHRAENHYVGAATGLLDQMSSMFGAPDTALLIDFRSLEVSPIAIDIGDAVLLVIDSRTPHSHATGAYGDRRASCEAAAAVLGGSLRDVDDDAWRTIDDPLLRRRARHVLTENRRTLDCASALATGDVRAFGAAMSASHASMRDDFEITTPAIDAIVAHAVSSGAHGARMTGGGFGGSVIAVASPEAADRTETGLPDLIEEAGHPRPTVRAVRAGAGAWVTRR